MACIKMRQSKRMGAAASQLTPRSQKKRASAPSQPAPVPDIPSPLGELPAEGGNQGLSQKSSTEKKGLRAGAKSFGVADRRAFGSEDWAVASRSPNQPARWQEESAAQVKKVARLAPQNSLTEVRELSQAGRKHNRRKL
jgi:hypothetical protein